MLGNVPAFMARRKTRPLAHQVGCCPTYASNVLGTHPLRQRCLALHGTNLG